MRAMHFEILGADSADVQRLADAVRDATGLTPTLVTAYAAHFTATDGITEMGVAPAFESIGPAQLFTLGPAGDDLAKAISAGFRASHDWILTPTQDLAA